LSLPILLLYITLASIAMCDKLITEIIYFLSERVISILLAVDPIPLRPEM